MARIRSLKPEFGHSEKLSAEHSEVHLLAALLLTYADDEGYFNANPKLVQAACCPLRELLVSVPEILVRLTDVGYIVMFTGSDGKRYGHIVKFLEHQRVTHPTPSKIKPLVSSPEKIVNPHEPFRPELKGNGIEREVEGEAIPEQQPPLNCARRLMEVLSLPQTPGFLRTVEASIIAEAAYVDMSPADAAQQIASHAMEWRKKGNPLDKWYFEETKWRNSNGKRQVSSVEHRVSGNREVLKEALATHVAQRVGPDGDKLKDGTGAKDQRRISASAG